MLTGPPSPAACAFLHTATGPDNPLSSVYRCLVFLPLRAADLPPCSGFLVGIEEQRQAAGRLGAQRLLPLPGKDLGVPGPRLACVYG